MQIVCTWKSRWNVHYVKLFTDFLLLMCAKNECKKKIFCTLRVYSNVCRSMIRLHVSIQFVPMAWLRRTLQESSAALKLIQHQNVWRSSWQFPCKAFLSSSTDLYSWRKTFLHHVVSIICDWIHVSALNKISAATVAVYALSASIKSVTNSFIVLTTGYL